LSYGREETTWRFEAPSPRLSRIDRGQRAHVTRLSPAPENSKFEIRNRYRRPLSRLRSRRETSTLFIASATGEATKIDE